MNNAGQATFSQIYSSFRHTHTHRHAYTHIYYASLYAPFEEKCFVGREKGCDGSKGDWFEKSRACRGWFGWSVQEIHLNKSVVGRRYNRMYNNIILLRSRTLDACASGYVEWDVSEYILLCFGFFKRKYKFIKISIYHTTYAHIIHKGDDGTCRLLPVTSQRSLYE